MSKSPELLSWQVYDAEVRFLSAPADVKWGRALRLVDARFERGDYPMLQALDEATRAALARLLIEAQYPNMKTPRP